LKTVFIVMAFIAAWFALYSEAFKWILDGAPSVSQPDVPGQNKIPPSDNRLETFHKSREIFLTRWSNGITTRLCKLLIEPATFTNLRRDHA